MSVVVDSVVIGAELVVDTGASVVVLVVTGGAVVGANVTSSSTSGKSA